MILATAGASGIRDWLAAWDCSRLGRDQHSFLRRRERLVHPTLFEAGIALRQFDCFSRWTRQDE